MAALPLSILALAAGVYLLIKVNREYLGGLFKFLAWAVIALSLLSTFGAIHHGIQHFRHHRFHSRMMEERIMMKDDGQSCAGGTNQMQCCKMTGDSVVIDSAMCSKMMGKDECAKICKERGRCILSKDECAKMCSASGQSCCAAGAGDKKECCKGDGKETKSCCKK